jgi:DNA helicase-2/ATP-dependent DNA helicase PcrA
MAAVRTLSGPLLVLAGAGSGKTRVITFRIAELIRSGIQPHRILAVTFTNKAAREMKERAMGLLGKKPRGGSAPEISTFHALCVRILRRHAKRLGYPPEFTIYDRSDQESVARQALREIRVSQDKMRPGDLLSQIGNWKTHSVRPDAAFAQAEGDRLQIAAMAYEKYQAAIKASGAMDFDDLLMLTEQLFVECPDVRFAEASRFDHLLIDEYQDTNGLQYRIVRALADRHRNLCVVGDDDQSIYGWRGAEVTHILSFQKDWPDAKVVKLEENYRSCSPILELANTLIRHNTERHDKKLIPFRMTGEAPRFARFDDETQEAQAVVREIRRRLDSEGEDRVRPCDVAILFRTNEQPRAFEVELRAERVPYVLVGGQSFYDRKEIRDVLSYLRVLTNPADEVSLLRIINTPPRGIGTGSIQAMLDLAVKSGEPLWAVLPRLKETSTLPNNVADRVETFRQLIERERARLGTLPIADFVRELLATVEYKTEIARTQDDPKQVDARWASVEELVNAIAQYEGREEKPTLAGFLEETTLSGREDIGGDSKKKEERNAVTLMTLHSAKGLEFPHVYLVGMEEGILPHARSVVDGGIQEERRLAYVGVTRARDTLTLTMAKTRMKWGKPVPSIPSRFCLEMRGETEKAQRAALAAEERFRSADGGPSSGRSAVPANADEDDAPASARPKRSTPPAAEDLIQAGPRSGERSRLRPDSALASATSKARRPSAGTEANRSVERRAVARAALVRKKTSVK